MLITPNLLASTMLALNCTRQRYSSPRLVVQKMEELFLEACLSWCLYLSLCSVFALFTISLLIVPFGHSKFFEQLPPSVFIWKF